jgi:hypothetical protein
MCIVCILRRLSDRSDVVCAVLLLLSSHLPTNPLKCYRVNALVLYI